LRRAKNVSEEGGGKRKKTVQGARVLSLPVKGWEKKGWLKLKLKF